MVNKFNRQEGNLAFEQHEGDIDQSTSLSIEMIPALCQKAIEGSDDAFICKSLTGEILCWNRAAEIMYGYTAREAIGKSIELVLPADRLSEFASALVQLRFGQRVRHHRTKRLRKDGRVIDVDVTISPILDDSGHVIAASSLSRDIEMELAKEKELEASERQFRELVERTRGILIHLRPDASIVFMNDYGLRFFGYERKEIVGQPVTVLEWWRGSARMGLSDLVTETAVDSKMFSIIECENRKKNGEPATVLWSNRCVHDASGGVLEILSAGIDVTAFR